MEQTVDGGLQSVGDEDQRRETDFRFAILDVAHMRSRKSHLFSQRFLRQIQSLPGIPYPPSDRDVVRLRREPIVLLFQSPNLRLKQVRICAKYAQDISLCFKSKWFCGRI